MPDLTIDDLIDQFTIYLEINRSYAAGTVENYRGAVLRLATWLQEKRNIKVIKEVTSADLELFLGTLRHPDGRVFEATTRQRIISGIRHFFRWTVKYQYLQTDVSQIIESPKLKQRTPKSISVEESFTLMKEAGQRKQAERDALMTSLFLLLGVRVSELTGIDLSDINYSKGTLLIRGKNNKERDLTLTPRLLRELAAYLPVRKEILEHHGKQDERALFVSEKRGQRLRRRSVGWLIETIAKDANVHASFNISPHKLRHTCATILYNDGDADLLAIAELLGHADPSTSKIYTTMKREKLRSVVESNPLERM